MSIYTKRGDKGETDLVGEKEASKSSFRVSAIGTVDELNSYLGVVATTSDDQALKIILEQVQEDLLTIGSILAGSGLRFFKTKTRRLEKIIDELEKKLPRLYSFILPGGVRVAAQLNFARTITRRAERELVALNEVENVKPQILIYINRLSDFLFMLARDTNYKRGLKDRLWTR